MVGIVVGDIVGLGIGVGIIEGLAICEGFKVGVGERDGEGAPCCTQPAAKTIAKTSNDIKIGFLAPMKIAHHYFSSLP
jgi:hypothetical protein